MTANFDKVAELLKDETFVAELGKAEGSEGVRKLFASKGAEFSDEEFTKLTLVFKKASGAELTEEELEAVAGGSGILGTIFKYGPSVIQTLGTIFAK
ncbi:MAG: hypothetical protein LBE22_03370 [Azoarcus sp.]|jgi:hypothetical protein|nr:hypothetical protein [Azoarcus sp.]